MTPTNSPSCSQSPLAHIVLFEPEKAGNVGNVARTCAVLGAELHLIRPYGFRLHDPEFRRAVMDYLKDVTVHEYINWTDFQKQLPRDARVWAFSAHAEQLYTRAGYQRSDYLVFGPESRGLPEWLLDGLSTLILPQPAGGRSLNMAVAVGVAAFEVGRQVYKW